MAEMNDVGSTHQTTGKTKRSTSEAFAIRSPCCTDYEKMADLARQLGYPSTQEQIRIRLSKMGGNDHAIFVAELGNGQIVGWIGVYIFRSIEMDDCTFISGLIVDETARSGGVGKQLLKAAEDWAQHHGCRVVCVSSNVIRTKAHAFYSHNGFIAGKTQTFFFKNLKADVSEEDYSTQREEPTR